MNEYLHHTRLFRDEEEWRKLMTLLPEGHINALSVGCSTGEEVFTLAYFLSLRSYFVIGIDTNDACINRAKQGLAELPEQYEEEFGHVTKFHVGFKQAAFPCPVEPSPNLVVCRYVMQYQTNKDEFAKALVNATSPGGLIFMGANPDELLTLYSDDVKPLADRIFLRL